VSSTHDINDTETLSLQTFFIFHPFCSSNVKSLGGLLLFSILLREWPTRDVAIIYMINSYDALSIYSKFQHNISTLKSIFQPFYCHSPNQSCILFSSGILAPTWIWWLCPPTLALQRTQSTCISKPFSAQSSLQDRSGLPTNLIGTTHRQAICQSNI
jgi:hypothetical protein